MCLNVEVILPTVKKFLLLYSLKCGCIITFLWTLIRTFVCVFFFSTVLLEVLVGKPFPLTPVFTDITVGNYYTVYYSFVILLLVEFLLLVYTINLGIGIFTENTYCLKHYLICRIVTWCLEVLFLSLLCWTHQDLIGWYLGILFFVVLEFYSFIVVYSHYYTVEDEKECQDAEDGCD